MQETEEHNPIQIARQHVSMSHGDNIEITLDNSILALSHLSKPLWQWQEDDQERFITKRQLLEYYLTTAEVILPHIQDRPLTIKRFPEGVSQAGVWQRHVSGELPDFVETVEICTDSNGTNEPFLLCQNAATLVWLANLDAIELHPWHSRINPQGTNLPTIFINSPGTLDMSVLNYPDWLILDIDPSEQGRGELHDFEQARQAAQAIHQHLEQMGLAHMAKLSGERGIHMYIPIKRLYPYDLVRKAAQRLSQQLAESSDMFTTEWHVDQRQGRVFLDWQQNSRAKSQAAPYSARAHTPPQASWPISWHDLATVTPQQFTLEKALHLPLPLHDPWQDILSQAQEIPQSLLEG